MQTIGDRGNLLRTKKITRFSVQHCHCVTSFMLATASNQSLTGQEIYMFTKWPVSTRPVLKGQQPLAMTHFSLTTGCCQMVPNKTSSLWLRTEVHDLSLTNLSAGCCYCYYFLLANLKVKVLKVKSFCYVLMLHSLPTGGHCVTHVFGTPQTR